MNILGLCRLTDDKAGDVLIGNFEAGHIGEIFLDAAAFCALDDERQPDQRPFDIAVLLNDGRLLLLVSDHRREEDPEQQRTDFVYESLPVPFQSKGTSRYTDISADFELVHDLENHAGDGAVLRSLSWRLAKNIHHDVTILEELS